MQFISSLIVLSTAVYLILVYGKILTPRLKTDEAKTKFLAQREARGSLLIGIGIVLIIVELIMIGIEYLGN